jgi:hypothetical protein
MADVPDERYASVAKLLRDLPQTKGNRRLRIACAAATVPLAALVVGAWYLVLRSDDPTPARAAGSMQTHSTVPLPAPASAPAPEAPVGDSARDASALASMEREASEPWAKLATLDRGQEFGPRLDGVKSRLENGRRMLTEHRLYDEAGRAFKDAITVGRKLLAEEEARGRARAARDRERGARKSAEESGAALSSGGEWLAALDLAEDAAIQFEAAEFAEAESLWTDAADRLNELAGKAKETARLQEATRVRAAEARDAMTKARDEAEAAGAEALAPDDWKEAGSTAAVAASQFDAGRYEDAERSWHLAARQYERAGSRARDVNRSHSTTTSPSA